LNHCCDLAEARPAAEDNYCGFYSSLADYAQELTEGCTEIPCHVVHYIGYETMARDMELNGDVFTVETDYQKNSYLLEPLGSFTSYELQRYFVMVGGLSSSILSSAAITTLPSTK
jgi:Antirestriction protein (ArdA)